MKENRYNLTEYNDNPDVMNAPIKHDGVGFCATDLKTREILFANHNAAIYAGRTRAEDLTGEYCYTSSGDGKKGCRFCPHKKPGNLSESHVEEVYVESLDIWLRIINQNVIATTGRQINMVTFYDITETKKMHEQLAESVYWDSLLGIKNDASLERDIQESDVKASLILFDILSLKKINESYGRTVGDYLLSSIRDWILSRNIPNSELYRIGGDKLCLAVNDIGKTDLTRLANKLSRLLIRPWSFEYEKKRLWVSCNISISVIPGKYIPNDEPLLCMIERTLERAGVTRSVDIFDRKADKAHKDRIELQLSLERCIHQNMTGFEIHYQPIVESGSGIWCGLEALCRWNSPDLGMVSPGVFIPETEELGLIGILDLWALETAVSKCKLWELDECDNFILNVNLSAAQFDDKSLSSDILGIIEKYDYPGEKLCIEITESTSVTFLDQSLSTIESLRTHNILVALDDFGTGYSSFNRLKSMPVDIVKIEQVFVADIEGDEYHRYLFHAMAELAHTADMKLIAEGVEREKQMDILINDGADYMQGYLFARPLPPAKLEDELSRFYERMPYDYFADSNNTADTAI